MNRQKFQLTLLGRRPLQFMAQFSGAKVGNFCLNLTERFKKDTISVEGQFAGSAKIASRYTIYDTCPTRVCFLVDTMCNYRSGSQVLHVQELQLLGFAVNDLRYFRLVCLLSVEWVWCFHISHNGIIFDNTLQSVSVLKWHKQMMTLVLVIQCATDFTLSLCLTFLFSVIMHLPG